MTMNRLRTLVTMLTMLVSACSTTSTSVLLQRAAKLDLRATPRVAVQIKSVQGQEIWRYKSSSMFDKVTDDPKGALASQVLEEYKDKILADTMEVLSKANPPIQVVEPDQAQATLAISITVKETREFEVDRRELTQGEKKGWCRGTVGVHADPEITVELLKNGQVVQSANAQWHGWASPFSIEPLIGSDQCYVACDAKEYLKCDPIGLKLEPTDIPFERVHQMARSQALAKNTEALTPLVASYDEKVDIVIYKLSKPEGVETAIEAMKRGQWDSAKTTLEQHLKAVRDQSSGLDAKDSSRFLYDYSLCLMMANQYRQASQVLQEASNLYQDSQYQTMLQKYQELAKEGGAKGSRSKEEDE